MKNRTLILRLAWLTLIGFSAVGFVIADVFMNISPAEMLSSDYPLLTQILFGGLTGWLCGLIAWTVITLPFMKKVRDKYTDLFLRSLRLRPRDVLFISFCAGVGEEILFRGGLQPIMGLWITSVVFVAIHGYLNPMSWRVSVYGVTMTGIIILLGWQSVEFGLVTSMSAHAVIDIYLLFKLTEPDHTEPAEPELLFDGISKSSEEETST